MKRKWMYSALAGLVLLCADLGAAPGDTMALVQLEGRVSNLELLQENLDAHVELKKQELAVSIQQQQQEAESQFWVTIISVVLAAGSLLGSFWIGVQKVKKVVLELALAKVKEEVLTQLPLEVNSQLKPLVEGEVNHLYQVSAKEKEEGRMRLTAQILVVGEDQKEIEHGLKELQKLGYANVKTHIPEGDTLPKAEVYFFHRWFRPDQNDYQLTGDSRIISYLDKGMALIKNEQNPAQSSTEGFFVFLPGNNERIGKKRSDHLINFANEVDRIDSNLLTHIRRLNRKSA